MRHSEAREPESPGFGATPEGGTFGITPAGRMQGFWLPIFALKRSIRPNPPDEVLNFMHRTARNMDRFMRRRFQFIARPGVTRVIATASLGLTLVIPFLELIPFSVNLIRIASYAFGLLLIAAAGVFGLVGYWVLLLP